MSEEALSLDEQLQRLADEGPAMIHLQSGSYICLKLGEGAHLLRTQAARIADLEAAGLEAATRADQAEGSCKSLSILLALLADIRAACGDHGKRMQPELVEHIRAGFAERDQLRAEVERLRREITVPTVDPNSQNWRGMDGAIAFHLIERHADNWSDAGQMMREWLDANRAIEAATTLPAEPSVPDFMTDTDVARIFRRVYGAAFGPADAARWCQEDRMFAAEIEAFVRTQFIDAMFAPTPAPVQEDVVRDAVLAEREACAKVCEDAVAGCEATLKECRDLGMQLLGMQLVACGGKLQAEKLRDAIRARSDAALSAAKAGGAKCG